MGQITEEILGKGVQLKLGDGGSPEQFEAIERLSEVPESPDVVRDLIEKTNHDSPGTNKEYILGLGEGKEVSFTFNYLNTANQIALRTAKESGSALNFQLNFPYFSPDETLQFGAVVRAWDILPPINGVLQLRVTLKTSGAATWL